jgi:hypothetical protein
MEHACPIPLTSPEVRDESLLLTMVGEGGQSPGHDGGTRLRRSASGSASLDPMPTPAVLYPAQRCLTWVTSVSASWWSIHRRV